MSWNQGNYIIKSEEVKVKGKVRQKVVTMITWAVEQPVDIIFIIVDNNGIPDCSQRWEW
jgi:hypothetical protein